MTEISKEAGGKNQLTGSRWPMDQDGRSLMGKLPPLPGKRKSVKNKTCFTTLADILDESNHDYLISALGNRPERALAIKKAQESQVECSDNEQEYFNSLNRILQLKRKPAQFNKEEALKELKSLYKNSSYSWPTKQEIVYRTAELLLEKKE
jgi:hypothetical protein